MVRLIASKQVAGQQLTQSFSHSRGVVMWDTKNKTLDGLNKKKIISNGAIYSILGLALLAMTFAGSCDPSGGLSGPTGAAAKVGDEVVTRADFNRAYQTTYANYQRQFGEAFDPKTVRVAETVMQQLVDERLLYQKAKQLGIVATEPEVLKVLADAELFKGEDGRFSNENFKNYLRQTGHTEASFMEEIKRNMSVQKLRSFVAQTAYVSDQAAAIDFQLAETKLTLGYLNIDPQDLEVTVAKEDVEAFVASPEGKSKVAAYYKANSSEFQQEAQVQARHILVGFKGARQVTAAAAERSKEEAKKRAEDILRRIQNSRDEFARIANETTDEASGKTKGGNLSFFTRSAMVKEFSDAAFAMDVGEVSQLVESPFGFHIIKVEAKKPAKDVSLEKATAGIAAKLLKKEKRPVLAKERADAIAAALTEKKPVEPLLQKYNLEWQSTGPVAANSRYIQGVGSIDEVGDALIALQKVGEVTPTPLNLRGQYYFLRLDDKTPANLTSLDQEKREQLVTQKAFSEGFALFDTLEKQTRAEFEQDDKIWLNPEYLALDDRDLGDQNRQQAS